MELRITQPEAAILAQRVATAMGVSVEEAVMQALRDQVQIWVPAHNNPSRSVEEKVRLAKELAKECRLLPVRDSRSLEEMLYDENGLPK